MFFQVLSRAHRLLFSLAKLGCDHFVVMVVA